MAADYIIYETPAPNIARIWLNRPEVANAQNIQLLYELNDAFDRAARDNEIRVIILAAKGKHFSAGHDLKEYGSLDAMERFKPVGNSNSYHRPGAEGRMSFEEEVFTGFSERWRNLPKATIASVQGKCISGGLLLCWPCDLIIASDDAQFQDVTVAMGIAGAEWFAHPWELGSRKAKEMLFTCQPIAAEEARMLGMVNRVVPRADLEEATLEFARTIAQQPSFAIKTAKLAVNTTQDAQGRHAAFQTAFALHHLGHSHWMEVSGTPVDETGLKAGIKTSAKS